MSDGIGMIIVYCLCPASETFVCLGCAAFAGAHEHKHEVWTLPNRAFPKWNAHSTNPTNSILPVIYTYVKG
jgi:hypothetical protein